MATHSGVLAWRISGTEEPGGLPSVGSHSRTRLTQLKSKIAGRNINNLRFANDTTLMAEREEELKSLLMKVKEESEKVG